MTAGLLAPITVPHPDFTPEYAAVSIKRMALAFKVTRLHTAAERRENHLTYFKDFYLKVKARFKARPESGTD